jgi:hypothetical protein
VEAKSARRTAVERHDQRTGDVSIGPRINAAAF